MITLICKILKNRKIKPKIKKKTPKLKDTENRLVAAA